MGAAGRYRENSGNARRRCGHAATTTARRSGYGRRTSGAHAPLAKAGERLPDLVFRERPARVGLEANEGADSARWVSARIPAQRPGSGHGRYLTGRTVGMSANPSAQPRPTGDIRPISGGAGTDRPTHHGHEYTHSYRYAPCRHKACGTLRPSPARARWSPWTHMDGECRRRHHARSGRRSPPPGPVRRLRGMRRRCSPSPPCPVQRADPRSTHASAPAGTGPERTAGRTATRQEHAPTPRTRAPARALKAVRAGRRTHPGARVLAGRRATGGPAPPAPVHSRNPVHGLGRFPRAPPPAISARGCGGAPQTLLRAPAFSPRFLRSSFARRSPPARPPRLSRHSRRPASWRPPRVAGTDNNPAIRTSGP